MTDDNLTVLILGSSFIHRMKSHGPPILFRDAFGRTVLEHQIGIVQNLYPKAEIVVVSGLWSDKLASFKTPKFRIVENQLFNNTNEIEDIRLALNNTNTKNILIINGDLYFNTATLNNLPEDSFVIYDKKNQLLNCDIGITIVDGNASILTFDLSSKYAGIIHINNKLFDKFKQICLDRSKNRLFLFEIINNLVNAGYQIKCVEPNNMKIYKITSHTQLQKIKEIALK